MNARTLCEIIDMPASVISEIDKFNIEEYREAMEHYWRLIQNRAKWDAATEEVQSIFADDKNGLKCLAFMMHVGIKTYQLYRTEGIPEQIYIDTMGCFSRFVKEYKESYGIYGFNREWWTVRELTLKEFRLGELEYEMIKDDDKRIISVHIPSDTKLERQRCRKSYQTARKFIEKYASDYADLLYSCESWLLSPKLNGLLSEASNIISFQNDFIMESFNPEDTGYMQWVFKNEALSLEEVPQKTSLQRRMKAYLKNGGIIGAGKGHIKKELMK